jgi:hypothetical protein
LFDFSLFYGNATCHNYALRILPFADTKKIRQNIPCHCYEHMSHLAIQNRNSNCPFLSPFLHIAPVSALLDNQFLGFSHLSPCSLGLSTISQEYFSLKTNQQPANSTFLSEQTSTSHQPPAKRTCCIMEWIYKGSPNGRPKCKVQDNHVSKNEH